MPSTTITIEQQSPTNSSSRSNSRSTTSYSDEEGSSGTGVHVSSAVDSVDYSDPIDDTWDRVYSDEIEPSESASRPRTSQRYRAGEPQPPATTRAPTRRHTTNERATRRPPVSRVHRHPAPIPPSSVDPLEDYPGYGRGYPVPPTAPYGGRAHPAGYAPSSYSAGGGPYAPPYGGAPGALTHYGVQGAFPYPSQHPFAPAPAPGPGGAGYFANPHHPMSVHSAPGYGVHDMSPYQQHPGFPYQGGYIPPTMPAQMPYYAPQWPSPDPATVSDPEVEKKLLAIEELMKTQKLDFEKAQKESAERESKVAKELADRDARAAKEKKEAEEKAAWEKKIEEEKAAAEKKGAEDANKKTEEEKKAAAAKAADDKAKVDAAAAAATAAAKALEKPAEDKKKPIKFKDAVGRKFSFPFHLCATWAGMEELIRQAFVHVEVIGPHVADGHYDLIGPNGEIILPQVWETMIEPDWSVTMHMWPMPERPPGPPGPPGGLPFGDRPRSRHDRHGHRGPAPGPPPPPGHRGPPPPPPANWPGGPMLRPPGVPGPAGLGPQIITLPPGEGLRARKKGEPAKGVLSWMAGKPAGKGPKKAEQDNPCRVM